jgi:predicted nucleic acid-binding protein
VSPVLLDASVVVALLDRSERYHERCVAAVQELESPLVTCEAAIAESCYLLRGLPPAVDAILDNVARGVFQVPFQLSRTAAEVAPIIRKFRDIPADLADACLIYAAGQLGVGDILTLDRDFEIYRWGRSKPFHLLVSLD